jgi:hypothetical protein
MRASRRDTLRLTIAILLAGVVVGVVGAAFTGMLGQMGELRLAMGDFALDHAIPGWLAAAAWRTSICSPSN